MALDSRGKSVREIAVASKVDLTFLIGDLALPFSEQRKRHAEVVLRHCPGPSGNRSWVRSFNASRYALTASSSRAVLRSENIIR